ncbi:YaaA family protein [Aeromicrobium terrae]|uniref:Peroxide stress protein YaaA n=1 Tax=Aeromicrobium terrae TaxID=2498846 RepID=A0A5C8NLK6_9ACTN|nr:peroxide stress protein YaaA [Aeromicrobium terrae]TXL62734.1 peroxide stress protein YaaA [Aeromicrobium terrae]
MLILLPPSEGKTSPATGEPLRLDALDLPALNPTRERVLRSLVAVCQGNATRAMKRLGLGPTQADAVERNAALLEQPAARADEVYTGVLFEAWDPSTLSRAVRRRADETVAIASALFGLVRPSDAIPAYRLSGTVTLPRLGPVAGLWRPKLGPVLDGLVGHGLLVDLRSGTYVNLHKPAGALAERTATVRVLHERDGKRSVVSHFNKATKGRVVRALLEQDVRARSIDELREALGDLGWTVERDGRRLDVVVSEL